MSGRDTKPNRIGSIIVAVLVAGIISAIINVVHRYGYNRGKEDGMRIECAIHKVYDMYPKVAECPLALRDYEKWFMETHNNLGVLGSTE